MVRLFNISRTIHLGEGAAPTVFFCTSAHQYNQNLPAGAPINTTKIFLQERRPRRDLW
jgi:hypothetical protein